MYIVGFVKKIYIFGVFNKTKEIARYEKISDHLNIIPQNKVLPHIRLLKILNKSFNQNKLRWYWKRVSPSYFQSLLKKNFISLCGYHLNYIDD